MRIIIIILLMLFSKAIIAQEMELGINYSSPPPLNRNYKYQYNYCGIIYKIKPEKQIFSYKTGLQYSNMRSILFPIYLNIDIGKKARVYFNGGIIPFIRTKLTWYNECQKRVGVAFGVGLGFEYHISKYTIFTDFGKKILPESSLCPDGSCGIFYYKTPAVLINFGVRYMVKKIPLKNDNE